MLPFRVDFRPGVSAYSQVVFAAKKSFVAGQLGPGDPFPSVRALSKGLKINPNTAHKVIAALVADGDLEVLPGIGTVVAKQPRSSARQRAALLDDDLERIVVEAKRLSLTRDDIVEALDGHWARLTPQPAESSREEAYV